MFIRSDGAATEPAGSIVRWSVHGVRAGHRTVGVGTLVVDQVGLVEQMRLSDCGRSPRSRESPLPGTRDVQTPQPAAVPISPLPRIRVSDGREMVAARDGPVSTLVVMRLYARSASRSSR
jgi:hypothetical protein